VIWGFSMRKFVFGSFITAMLVAVATMAMPVRSSFAATECYMNCIKHAPQQQNNSSNGNPIWVACIIGSATAEIIGAAAHGNDQNDPRQSTIFEAGWYAAACPALLPLALVVSATCPDNKATLAIARLAHRYGLTHQPADWTPFTNAYGQACRDGTLSSDFLKFLKANRLRVGHALRG
jgi:hypothetical protein